MKLCDLHTHSVFSDGTFSPEQIIDSSIEAGLSAIALTDHNTVSGLPGFMSYAKGKHIDAVPGIEFSTGYMEKELHILGLFIKPDTFDQAALPTAEALVTQYVSAVALMQECQTAVKAVSQFTEENINELNTAYDANLYNNFNQYRHSMDDDDAAIALVAAANGVKNFQTKYDRPVYINKNADTAGREVRLDYDQGRRCVWNKDRSDYLDVEGKVKENALTIKELTAIADHVRTKFPARSMYEYLTTDMRINANVTGDCYIILSDQINISKTRNSKIDKSFNDGIYKCAGYDRVGTVKAIRMGDRNKAVVDLKLFTYQQWDDEFMKSILGTYYAVGLSDSTLFKVKMVRVYNA